MKQHTAQTRDKGRTAPGTQRAYGARERGFTLLLAALVASVVLALGTSIFSLVQKEITLSSIGRDSQFAFYAADTGVECALYWDARHQIFADEVPPSEITCDTQTVPVTVE